LGGVCGFDVPALLAAASALGLAGEDVLTFLPDLETGLLEGLRGEDGPTDEAEG
jgi:hypothetical protein